MKLQTRFTLVILVIFLIGWIISAISAYILERQNALQNTIHTAEILLNTADAARNYTSEEIQPLLKDKIETQAEFIPQTIPSYSAQQLFARLDGKYKDYTYVERALNPTNLNDLAEGWQVEVIQTFIQNPDLTEIIHERVPINKQETFIYIAQPIKVNSVSCLQCHGTPDNAPKSQLKTYGDNNGFGWKLDEVIGVRIISTPKSLPQLKARQSLFSYLLLIAGIFLIAYTIVSLLIRIWIISPLNQIADLVEQVSLRRLEWSKLPEARTDEFGKLNKSINRLVQSLKIAISQ